MKTISMNSRSRRVSMWTMELTDATLFLTTCSKDRSEGSFDRRDDFPSSMLCMSLEISDSGSIVAV